MKVACVMLSVLLFDSVLIMAFVMASSLLQ